ncbi:hypothetical protein ABHF54_00570 [Nitrosomonas europaea]|uniref:hypothetical protein n=1 Tax=Nitrosomonas europaea TaxID=915 RepID=UPI003265A96B
MQTTIHFAMSMLTRATSIKHILDDDAEELSCGQVHYALELDGRFFLVWNDMDSGSMIVSPVEHWDLKNLLEAIDDPMPVLSFAEIAASALAARATH